MFFFIFFHTLPVGWVGFEKCGKFRPFFWKPSLRKSHEIWDLPTPLHGEKITGTINPPTIRVKHIENIVLECFRFPFYS